MPPTNGRHANVRSHRRGGPRRRLAVAPWIVFVSVSALIMSTMTGGYMYLASAGCSGEPISAHILAAPSITQIMNKLARSWQDTRPTVTDNHGNQRCASVEVTAKASADVAVALGNDWDPRQAGPRPDVWIPESTAWARQAATDSDAERLLPDLQPSLARTPTVVAMPEPMVKLLTAGPWATTKPTWYTIIAALGSGASWENYGQAAWGPLKVGMSDPTKSTASLHALLAVADSNADGDVDSKERQAVWVFKQAVARSAMYKDSTEQFLAELTKADEQGPQEVLRYITGFPALERDIFDYNATKPKVPLAAVYPEGGSADADHPYLILESNWKDTNKQKVAKEFLNYLRGEKGRSAFLAAGFRDPNRIAGAALTATEGIQPHIQALPGAVLLPESVTATTKTWVALSRPVNILLVMDTSGSMDQPVPGTGRTRLDIAKEAAATAIGMFGTQARLGLWAFSTNRPGGKDYHPLAPIAALEPDQRATLTRHINDLTAEGGTGLYNSTWAALGEVHKNYLDGAANVVVVITDGKDEASTGGLSLDTLVNNMKEANAGEHKVQVVTIGYGPEPDFVALQKIAWASGGRALQSRTARDIGGVMLDALFS